MRVYYNEHDAAPAQWLRELMKAGAIPAGDVDERDIEDVPADDLRGYDQCHFFAGISGWTRALDLAGWDGPVWTASCPCPPFSAAGKKGGCPECASRVLVPCPRRTGYFICAICNHAWLYDARHLWPEVWRLVAERRPPVIFGEQVASADGRVWLAGVRASLEILGHGFGSADLCAAGAGAPNIRQRLFWVADSECERCERISVARPSSLLETMDGETEPQQSTGACGSGAGGVGNTVSARLEGQSGHGHNIGEPGRLDTQPGGPVAETGATGFWSDFDLIPCTDGKSRRVEPGTFPLVDGVPGRVGLLRGYGNAINPENAAQFIAAYMESRIAA